ncbi:MAG: ScyD/ScyE family protein [Propionibacteriales bacterium]|nr:ScyD/ScyE family protein [Propionibacteriales bacterium]
MARIGRTRAAFRVAAVLTSTVAVGIIGTINPASADDDPPWKVIATGLDNPRQLTFGDDDDDELYVVEAGEGGAGPCVTGPEGDEVCFGMSGAVTKVDLDHKYKAKRVLKGLPSVAGEGGANALGPSDIAFDDSKFALTIGLGADPAARPSVGPGGRALGTLVGGKIYKNKWSKITDLAAFEAAKDPDKAGPDSNPVSVIYAEDDDDGYVAVDAGGNTLLSVSKKGKVKTLAVFPDVMVDAPPFLGLPPGTKIPMQAVPTSVVEGRDGAYYVSQLTGFPFPEGEAKIWRVKPGNKPKVYAEGLTNVTDLAVGPKGKLYAVELAEHGLLSGSPGRVAKIDAWDDDHKTVVGGLVAPYGIAIDGKTAYVTTGSVAANEGQVIKFRL